MTDTAPGGNSDVQGTRRSDSKHGTVEAGSGTPDQGAGPECDPAGADPRIPNWDDQPGPIEGFQVSGAGEDDLYFRSQVLEKITQESSNDTKLALIRLLDEEGNRSRTIAEAEMQAGVTIDIRTLELQQAEKDADAKIQQERIKADTAADQRKGLALRHVSWRFTVTTLSPVIFAMLVAVFMFLFWKWQQPDAAGAFEKILVMLITGGLGWAAGRGRAQGAGRLEDRMPPAPKEGEDRT